MIEDIKSRLLQPIDVHGGLTLIDRDRLDNLQECIAIVLSEGIQGDLLEAGVWRGGASILMKIVLNDYKDYAKKLFMFDTFNGFGVEDVQFIHDQDGFERAKYLSVNKETVISNMKKFSAFDERVILVEGKIEDTLLPYLTSSQIFSVIRLDTDRYASTYFELEHLYPSLSSGGFVIIDDYYAHAGSQNATNDFRINFGVDALMTCVSSSIWWRKP